MKVGSRMNYQPFSNASFAFRERLLMAERRRPVIVLQGGYRQAIEF
jgi:hypothetical protein